MTEEEIAAEAAKRYPPNHMVDDPFGATGEAESDPYGYDETARKAFIAGVDWAMHKNELERQNARDINAMLADLNGDDE